MTDRQSGGTLGYSKSKGQYHVDEIRGSWPTASYQHSTGGTTGPVQVETITVHVGDWLSEREVEALGARTHLTVKSYRLDD